MSVSTKTKAPAASDFRSLCHRHGLAATHQRTVIYNALMSVVGHPSPEDVYEQVRQQIPSISLATVYKTLHAFVDAGIVHEVNLHRGSMRVETNLHQHHHLVCTECRNIEDLDENALQPIMVRKGLPDGFVAMRFTLEIQGLCKTCAAKRLQKAGRAKSRA